MSVYDLVRHIYLRQHGGHIESGVRRMARTESGSIIETRHLRLVAAVAEHGTITIAARSLQLTQPAVSHQLSNLESRLRTPLFIRTQRRMVLTSAGEQLVRIARSVLTEITGFEN